MEKYIKKFDNANLVVFSMELNYSETKQQKQMIYPKGYNTFTVKTPHNQRIDGCKSGMCLRMGTEYENDKFIILIDVDNKTKTLNDGTIEHNGYDLWKLWNIKTDTPSETTPSGGKHYYFYVNSDEYKYLKGGKTTMIYNDQIYAVDYKFKNQLSTIAPSYYMKNDVKMSYKCDNHFIYNTAKIEHLPQIIFDTIKTKQQVKHAYFGGKRTATLNDDNEKFTIGYTKEQIEPLLKFIGKVEDFERYRNLGFIVKNLNHKDGLALFTNWCRPYSKFDENQIIKDWNYHKCAPNMTLDALYKLIKQDHMEGYETVIPQVIEKRLFDTIKFKSHYLSDDEMVVSEIDKFMTVKNQFNDNGDFIPASDTKFLNFISPYGTGKTKLLIKLFEDYDMDEISILMITYRRTLAMEQQRVFYQFGFKNYLDGVYDADKQIIQLDSIDKIKGKYDMIIIDEIESVLAHLTGGTINKKGLYKSEHVYGKLCEIIRDATKVITMDGDFDNRSYSFINSFGCNSIILENEYKPKGKTFHIVKSNVDFNDILIKHIKQDKKVVICCMSCDDCLKYEKQLTMAFPKKTIMQYSSKSDDKTTTNCFKDVNAEWVKCDILIYSPSIESGIDFNVKHFDNLFVVYSGFSTCPRGLNQMMNRVRNYNDNNVYCLFDRLFQSGVHYTYTDICEYYKCIVERELTNFDKLYCYNLLEQDNSHSDFYNIFVQTAQERGHTVIECETTNKKVKNPSAVMHYIANAKNITHMEYEEMKATQKHSGLIASDKWAIEKYQYSVKFGIDIDETNIKDVFNKKSVFDNYTYLMDEHNIDAFKNHEEGEMIFTVEKKIKLTKCVENIITSLGFANMFDTAIIQLDIDEAMPYVERYHKLTHTTKKVKENTKSEIGAINSILKQWGICISMKKDTHKTINGKREHICFYSINHIMDRYIQNRIATGSVWHDKHNHFEFKSKPSEIELIE